MELLGGKIDRRLPLTILSDRKKSGAKNFISTSGGFPVRSNREFRAKTGTTGHEPNFDQTPPRRLITRTGREESVHLDF